MSKCKKCSSESKKYRLGGIYQTCQNCGHKQKKSNHTLKQEANIQKLISRFGIKD